MRQKTTIKTISQQWWPQKWAASVHFPIIHLPSSLYSPIWRHVSASFKTENFKWISYITHSPHATMNRSITLSAGAKPARQAHTLTHFHTRSHPFPLCENHLIITSTWEIIVPSRCLIWIKPLATNYVLMLNKLAFLHAGAVNHQHSWTRCFLREIIFTRCNERHHPLYAVWRVGKNKKLGIHRTPSSTLFLSPRNIFLWLKGNFYFIIFKLWASNAFECISQIFLNGWSLFSCHEAMT